MIRKMPFTKTNAVVTLAHVVLTALLILGVGR